MTTPSRPVQSNEIRRLILRMVLSVAVVHTLAIVVHQVMGIEARPDRTRTIFTVVWIGTTLIVVLHWLGKIRATRDRARRARARS